MLFKIPCSKSVNVCVCQKYPNKELHPDGKDSLWDAKTGFTVPSYLISYAGVVSCQTRIGNETFKSPLYIVAVVGKTEKRLMPKKTINCVSHKCVLIELKWKGDCWGRVCSLRRTIGRWLTPVSSRPFPQDTKSMSSRWPPRMSSFLWESGWCSAARPKPSSTWESNSTGRTLVRRWSVPHALLLSFSALFNELVPFK